jgi:hypothetical protein
MLQFFENLQFFMADAPVFRTGASAEHLRQTGASAEHLQKNWSICGASAEKTGASAASAEKVGASAGHLRKTGEVAEHLRGICKIRRCSADAPQMLGSDPQVLSPGPQMLSLTAQISYQNRSASMTPKRIYKLLFNIYDFRFGFQLGVQSIISDPSQPVVYMIS